MWGYACTLVWQCKELTWVPARMHIYQHKKYIQAKYCILDNYILQSPWGAWNGLPYTRVLSQQDKKGMKVIFTLFIKYLHAHESSRPCHESVSSHKHVCAGRTGTWAGQSMARWCCQRWLLQPMFGVTAMKDSNIISSLTYKLFARLKLYTKHQVSFSFFTQNI